MENNKNKENMIKFFLKFLNLSIQLIQLIVFQFNHL